MPITYLIGDATNPIGDGLKLIIHITNDINAWGRGFVLALSRRWKEPENEYRKLRLCDRQLGNVQFIQVTPDIYVANMIAQHGIGAYGSNQPPIRYDALRSCLIKVNEFAIANKATIHAPMIGAGLAGGDWNIIENLIRESVNAEIFIYKLK
jgi:hypothetical protein